MKIKFQLFSFSLSFVLFNLTSNINAQSIYNHFEEGNNAKIMEWIGNNPTRKVAIASERFLEFYKRKHPLDKLNCIPDSTAVLNVAIWFGNSAVYDDLLKNKKITADGNGLSEALNFAVAKNNLALVKRLESLGAKYNAVSPYFFGQNTLQIALHELVDAELISLVISKSDAKAFEHVDCLWKSALNYAAANRDVSFMSHFLKRTELNTRLGGENMEYPIESLLRRGNLKEAKAIWVMMKKSATDEPLDYLTLMPRFRYHAVLSRNSASVQWVDSVYNSHATIKQGYVSPHLASMEPFDLNQFIDNSIEFSEYQLDLQLLVMDAKDKTFLELLKSYQSMLGTFLQLNPGIQPTFHSRSKLISYEDLLYVSRLYSSRFWFPIFQARLKPNQMEMLQDKQEVFQGFLDMKMPKPFQSNFKVSFEELTGYDGELLDKLTYLINGLNVQQLTVTDVSGFELDYSKFFPYLNFLDIQWTNTEYKTFYIQKNLLYCSEIRFKGISELHLPNLPKDANLSRIYVAKGTKVVNAPRGFDIVYE